MDSQFLAANKQIKESITFLQKWSNMKINDFLRKAFVHKSHIFMFSCEWPFSLFNIYAIFSKSTELFKHHTFNLFISLLALLDFSLCALRREGMLTFFFFHALDLVFLPLALVRRKQWQLLPLGNIARVRKWNWRGWNCNWKCLKMLIIIIKSYMRSRKLNWRRYLKGKGFLILVIWGLGVSCWNRGPHVIWFRRLLILRPVVVQIMSRLHCRPNPILCSIPTSHMKIGRIRYWLASTSHLSTHLDDMIFYQQLSISHSQFFIGILVICANCVHTSA